MKSFTKTRSFLIKCRRVWRTLKKPTRKEFEQITKVSAIGIAILGVLGFLISMAMKIFVK